jgi:putative ABC transport system substrate-binding protein
VATEYRWAENQFDRLPTLAADLVGRRIPVVFAAGGDPVALGLAARRELTGSTILKAELAPKRLQLLHQVVPNAARLGVLADPASTDVQSIIADLQAAARALGLQVVVVNARTDSDLEMAFATFSQQHVGAVLGRACGLPVSRPEQLLAAAVRARHRIR